MSSITNLSTTTALIAEINEVKTSNITNLATTTDLKAAENKIPNVSKLVKKHWLYNTKFNKIEIEVTTNHDHVK